ncbi:hypothetical protein Y032_0053g2374 [Ancylostoma ceylanicum]|uniref:GMEB1/2/Spe-44-like domain-containing protein n=1 Tax=Ancylostoma ceylanicum TaxID=53326 RepID=A0A016U8J4_9BILA|nr:hypothetical protein Y032_0053g2374 [Ancylostoma ceylanicum]
MSADKSWDRGAVFLRVSALYATLNPSSRQRETRGAAPTLVCGHSELTIAKPTVHHFFRNSLQAEKAAAQISQLFNSRILNSNNCRIDAGSISHLIQLSKALNNINENNTNNNYIRFNNDDNSPSFPLTIFNGNPQPYTEELVDVDDSFVTAQNTNVPTTEQILLLMLTEPVSFWNEMHKFGLLDELVDQLTQCLSDIKRAAKTGGLTWAAPVLTRVVSVLNMSDRIATCIHSKPSGKLPTKLTAMPRVSTDYSSVEVDSTQKRLMDEGLQPSQPHCSPNVKRPRFQNPGMDPDVMRALAQAQVHITQDAQGVFVPGISSASTAGTLLTSKFA